MDCLLTQGYINECHNAPGGAQWFYITNWENVESYTVASGSPVPANDGMIDDITMAANTYFYKFKTKKDTSSATETIQEGPGGAAYEQNVELHLLKNEAALRNTVKMLGQANLVCIVVKRDGTCWAYGLERGLTLTAGSNATGVAATDFNGWVLNLTDVQTEPAMEVDPTILSTLVEA